MFENALRGKIIRELKGKYKKKNETNKYVINVAVDFYKDKVVKRYTFINKLIILR